MNEVVFTVALLAALVAAARSIHLELVTRYFKLTYADSPVWTFFYFCAWALAVALLFPADIARLFAHVGALGYLALTFLFVVVFPLVFRFLRVRAGTPAWLAEQFPDEPILSPEEGFILAKVADVVFQDFVAGALIFTLFAAGFSYPAIVGIFIILFAAAHLYIFITSGFFWGLYYTTYAALGGFAIPFLVLFVGNGIVYVLILHMLFYVLSAAFFAKLPQPNAAVSRHLAGASPESVC
ncbi:MAG: hypothetical protein KGI41_01480 [Patescibacteria group bacterium]|nr:hypothetical protein [Patescibacteria group bacterium]